MNHRTYKVLREKQLGLSLIELMVALLIGLLLLGGLIQIFSSTRTNFRVQTSLNFMQENLRVAASEIGYSLRMAGHFHTIAQPRTINVPTGTSLIGTVANTAATAQADVLSVGPSAATVDCGVESWAVGLQGFEGAATDPTTGGCLPGYMPNTDVFAVTYLRPLYTGPVALGVLTPPVANQLYGLVFDIKDKEIGTSQGGLIGTTAADLTAAITTAALYHDPDTVQGKRAIARNGTGDQARLKRTAAMMPLELELYYIRACSVALADGTCAAAGAADGGRPQPTLVRVRRNLNNMVREALVEGVEQMQIEYSASGCGRYMNATAVAAWGAGDGCSGTYTLAGRWQRVLNARVQLVSRSNEIDPAVNDAGPYNLSGDTPTYNPSVGTVTTLLPQNGRYRRALLVVNGQPRNATRPLPAP
jgi:type IV pilus assembly protein PilW